MVPALLVTSRVKDAQLDNDADDAGR